MRRILRPPLARILVLGFILLMMMGLNTDILTSYVGDPSKSIQHMNPQGTLEGALFIAVEAGILLAGAYMLTGRLWLSMGFHFSWNYTQSAIFSGIVSGNDASQGLIKSTVKGPDILTGGNFGVESSIVALILCTTTGVVMVVMAAKRGNIVPPIWKRGD